MLSLYQAKNIYVHQSFTVMEQLKFPTVLELDGAFEVFVYHFALICLKYWDIGWSEEWSVV